MVSVCCHVKKWEKLRTPQTRIVPSCHITVFPVLLFSNQRCLHLYVPNVHICLLCHFSVIYSIVILLYHSLHLVVSQQFTSTVHCNLQFLLLPANLLTLNSSKTEFLLVGLPQQLAKINTSSLITTHSARNLGFIFYEHLTFSNQISALSKSCYYHIRELHCLRPYLDFKTASTIATSVVHPKLDYCNSLYYNLPQTQIKKNSRTSRTFLLMLLPERQNLLTSLLFSNLYTG